jgi:exo-beta-1,3-glucanase (GH17 family)
MLGRAVVFMTLLAALFLFTSTPAPLAAQEPGSMTPAVYLPSVMGAAGTPPSPTSTFTPTPTHTPSPTPTSTPTPTPTPTDPPTTTPIVAYKLHGLSFSPYTGEQDPNLGAQVSEAQLRAHMAIIAPYTHWISTHGMGNGMEKAGQIAHEFGLKAALGAWLGRETTAAGKQANVQQIANLIAAANAGEAEMVIVGSEVLYRGDLPAATLISYINQVQSAVPATVTVATADTFDRLIAHSDVMAAVDIVLANSYPYWAGLHITAGLTTLNGATISPTLPFSQSIAALDNWYKQTQAVAAGKQVIVGETGWPSCGDTRSLAVPSPENAALYFRNAVSWARANQVDYFYFEAFDEPWKTKYEGPQGACWGLWDKDGLLKAGMQPVFDGAIFPDNWSGEPALSVSYVPPYGTSDDSQDDLRGHAWHITPADYHVAVYIQVNGGWWTKPTAAQPTVPVTVSGAWQADVNTGGSDYNATRFVAYLLPKTVMPPLQLGSASLPDELDEYPKVEVTRSP